MNLKRILERTTTLLAALGLSGPVLSFESNDDRYHENLSSCIATIKTSLAPVGTKAPEFTSIKEAGNWVATNLPSNIRPSLDLAGGAVRKRIDKWIDEETIIGAFSNPQLANELLWSQHFSFEGVCSYDLGEPGGTVGEILEDQLYIIFVADRPVEDSLRSSGLVDLAELRSALFYAVILAKSGLEWNEEDLVALIKYSFNKMLNDNR